MRTVLTCLFLSSSLIAMGNDTSDVALVFTKQCSLCHGRDGKASTPIAKRLGVKDLAESKISDAELKKQILDGRQGPDGRPVMPAFKAKLKEAEIDLLVEFVKKFRN